MLLAAGLLVYKKTRPTGIAALLSITVGFLITNVLLKNIVARPRPFDAYTEIIPLITKPTDFSFPSGHTCASFACALILFRMLPKKFGIPAVILAGMVAFSRLYLGVHYPGDVLGGFLVAVFASTLVYHLMSAYQKKCRSSQKVFLINGDETNMGKGAAIKTALTYIKEMNLVQRMSIFTRKTNKADNR